MADVVFKDNSIAVKNAMEEAAVIWLIEACGEVEAQTIRNSRVGDGQVKGSWRYQIDESNLKGVVGSPLENAIWEEFGTGEHALEGKGRKTPWYVPVDGYMGKKKPTYNGKVIIVYGKNGKAYYKTNGKKPNRALFKAYTTSKNGLIRRAAAVLNERLK